jgi:hypothetical protein
MTTQLHLLNTEPEWKIPEATKEIGRRGLAEARAVLRSIPRRVDADAVVGSDTGPGNGPGDHHHPAAA